MATWIKQGVKYLILFLIGGSLYFTIEILFRGHSHWTMFVLGGMCFILLGVLNEIKPELSLCKQMVIGTVIITFLEFIAGCILNLWLGLGIWNYSNMPLNILGQVCLPFCLAWFGLSAVAVVLDDCLRYVLFQEELPEYKWF